MIKDVPKHVHKLWHYWYVLVVNIIVIIVIYYAHVHDLLIYLPNHDITEEQNMSLKHEYNYYSMILT